jgi:uncharacterized protein (TIGR02996 family)
MATSQIDLLLNAVLANSAEDAFREMLRSALIATGAWDWPTVRGYVLAHPEADGPRLLAADWLEDDAQFELAEFIRVQCRLITYIDVLGAGAHEQPDVVELLAAQERLADALRDDLTETLIGGHGSEWSGGVVGPLRLRGGGMVLDFSRGFVGRVELDTEAFLDRAAEFFRTQPIAAVRLIDKAPMRVAEGWWWADSCLAPSDPESRASYLPPGLYSALLRGPAGDVTGPRGLIRPAAEMTFPTFEAALAALSFACVAHGRSVAGLAPLSLPPMPGAIS